MAVGSRLWLIQLDDERPQGIGARRGNRSHIILVERPRLRRHSIIMTLRRSQDTIEREKSQR